MDKNKSPSPWLSMTAPEWDELRKMNGGMPIKDADTQNDLHSLRNMAQMASPTTALQLNTDAFGRPIYAAGVESNIRRASVPTRELYRQTEPTDYELVAQKQKAILDKQKFQNQLNLLGMKGE